MSDLRWKLTVPEPTRSWDECRLAAVEFRFPADGPPGVTLRYERRQGGQVIQADGLALAWAEMGDSTDLLTALLDWATERMKAAGVLPRAAAKELGPTPKKPAPVVAPEPGIVLR